MQKTFTKSYAGEAEEYRMKNFLEKLKEVNEYNKLYDEGKVSYKKGINALSDLVSCILTCMEIRKVGTFIRPNKITYL